MRTKALLLSAALCAAVVPSAIAQVYSVNAVGFINLPEIPAGNFAIIANQLDNGAGNMLTDVLSDVPGGTRVYAFDVAAQDYIIATYDDYDGAWLPADQAALIDLSPGKGVFLLAGSQPVNITLVGDVPQNVLTVGFPNDGVNFNLISSKVPQRGDLVADLKYTPTSGDRIYRFDPAAQDYTIIKTYDDYDGAWLPVGGPDDMTIEVGEGFWIKAAATSSGEWTRDFDINDPNS